MTTAVVVGSGPNGLAAAVTLAAAGVEVTVLEASDSIGGGAQSRELTLPGLIHDESSGFHPLALGSAFAREFDLEGAGLTWRWPEVQFAHPLDGGLGAALWQSVATTRDHLGADGRAWERLFGPLAERFETIAQEFLQPMLHVPRHPLHLARFGLAAGLPAQLLARRFSTEAAQALFAGAAAHAFRPLNTLASSAIGVALTTAAHAYGWQVAEGGTGAITDAVLRRAREHGVRVETGREVTDVRDLGSPDILMLDTSPSGAAGILGDAQPERARRAYRRYRHGPGAFKVDYAVEGGVPWTHEPSTRAGTLHLGGTLAEIAATEQDVAAAGCRTARSSSSVSSTSPTPPARPADVHPVYAYAHVPSGYTGDATEAITAQFERFAPGFRDRIRAVHVRSTQELESSNANYIGGDIVTGSNDVLQLVFRPRKTLRPYWTGADGAYLCSAATPPGAGAHGMCGYNAAHAALADLSGR